MEDDIYDDGSNISNATAVSRMKSLFEAPAAETKPFRPPAKKIMRPIPGAAAVNHGTPSLPSKGDKAEEDRKTANGTAEGNKKPENKITSELPPWKNRVEMFNKPTISPLPPKTAKPGVNSTTTSPEEKKDENSNTVSVNSAKRSSKVNIPTAFAGVNNNAPPPITPKKPVVFPKTAEKTDTKTGDETPPVKEKPAIPRKGMLPTQGSACNLQEELKRKFSGKENDFKSADKKQDGGQKEPVRPGKLNRDNVFALQKKLSGSATDETADSSEKVPLRPKSGSKFSNRKSVKRKSLTRTNDGSKFYLVEMSLDDNTEKKKDDVEPDIPPPLVYSDLQRLHEIIQEYKTALRELEGYTAENDAGVIEEIEDVYEAIPADMDEPPPIPSPHKHKKLSRAVSLIQPMSEKDEYNSDDQDTYDDTMNFQHKDPPSIPLPIPPELDLPAPPDDLLKPPVPEGPIPSRRKPSTPVPEKPADTPPPLVPQKDDWPDEVYDDCTTESTQDESTAEPELEQDDVYEAIPGEGESIPPPTPEKPEEKKEEKKDEKLSAKEKKKREKEEAERIKAEKKRQEAEKKRQEKELKEIKKNFKIDTSLLDKSQGEGLLKEDAVPSGGKTAKLELSAKKGAFLKVIRLVDNPPGKWLVRLMEEEKSDKPVYLSQIVGYVDANIVEVDNQLIRNVMAGSFATALNSYVGDGEEYQDVEVEAPPVEDEMYEAV